MSAPIALPHEITDASYTLAHAMAAQYGVSLPSHMRGPGCCDSFMLKDAFRMEWVCRHCGARQAEPVEARQ